MNDVLTSGIKAVRSAERQLRELLQQASAEGQYDRVTKLARWAEQLSQIGANGSASLDSPPQSRSSKKRSAPDPRTARTSRSKAKRSKSVYPIFKRGGDNLIKLAWSKSSKSEYQHQAPKAVVFALLEKMQQSSAGDALITMDNMLPLSTDDQAEVPAYQSYACLAWLRSIGVVEQHGRQGYSVLSLQEAKSEIEKAWSSMAVHRS